MKKLLSMLLCACMFAGFAACGSAHRLNPVFLPLEEGLAALQPLMFYSHGWRLQAQGNFLFADFDRYVVRYNIDTNEVDVVIDRGEAPPGFIHAFSISEDGRQAIAFAWEFPGIAGTETRYMLIDFERQSVARERWLLFGERLEAQYRVERDQGWQFVSADNSRREITALQPYALGLSEIVVIDETRVGGLVQPGPGLGLGFHKFIVVDVMRDEIVQEFPLNQPPRRDS